MWLLKEIKPKTSHAAEVGGVLGKLRRMKDGRQGKHTKEQSQPAGDKGITKKAKKMRGVKDECSAVPAKK
jgi:hypothetical protein